MVRRPAGRHDEGGSGGRLPLERRDGGKNACGITAPWIVGPPIALAAALSMQRARDGRSGRRRPPGTECPCAVDTCAAIAPHYYQPHEPMWRPTRVDAPDLNIRWQQGRCCFEPARGTSNAAPHELRAVLAQLEDAHDSKSGFCKEIVAVRLSDRRQHRRLY